MTCASCAAKIEKKLNTLDGIIKASVNLATEKASIEFDGTKIKISDMIKAVDTLGYKAERDEEADKDDEKERREKAIKRLRSEFIISAVLSSPLIIAMLLTVLKRYNVSSQRIFSTDISHAHTICHRISVL